MKVINKILCFLFLAAGLVTVMYPRIHNYVYEQKNEVIIRRYAEKAEDYDTEEIWNSALKRNERVYNADNNTDIAEGLKDYEAQLNINGIMGYITIPKIKLQLPIYHGTSKDRLLKGAGHLENTSLPVGGRGTHCVITGHTGMADADFFNNLDKLNIGDRFYITTAGHVLAYEVDRIRTVLPDNSESVKPESGMDYCTLVTCTPYGINTHRLLVRGKRSMETEEYEEFKAEGKSADNKQIILVAALSGTAVIMIIIILWRKNEPKGYSKKNHL